MKKEIGRLTYRQEGIIYTRITTIDLDTNLTSMVVLAGNYINATNEEILEAKNKSQTKEPLKK